MSDNYVRWIPIDPTFVPEEEAVARTLVWLRGKRAGLQVEARASSDVQFIDCGNNLESIHCNRCGQRLDFDWWSEKMSIAYASRFTDRTIQLPCCGASEMLEALNYWFPIGFARFVLDAMNPNGIMGDEDDARIAQDLGTPVRRTYKHV